MRFQSNVSFLLLFLFFHPATAGVQPVGDLALQIALEAPDERMSVAPHTGLATRSGHNEYLVAWTDYEQDQVLVQRMRGPADGHAGERVGEPGVISSEEGIEWSWVGAPTIAYSPVSDRYLLTWRSGSANGDRIALRAVDAGTLQPVGPHRFLNAIQGALFPQLAWNDAAQEFLAIWLNQKYRPYLYRPRVVAQRLSAFGEVVGNNIAVHDFSGALSVQPCEQAPRVIATAQGYMVGWAEQNEQYGARQLLARKLDLGGQALNEVTSLYTRGQQNRFLCDLDLFQPAGDAFIFAAWREWYWNNEDHQLKVARIAEAHTDMLAFTDVAAVAGDGLYTSIGTPRVYAPSSGDLAVSWLRTTWQNGVGYLPASVMQQTLDPISGDVTGELLSVAHEDVQQRSALNVAVDDASGNVLMAWLQADAPKGVYGRFLATVASPQPCDGAVDVPWGDETTLWVSASVDCEYDAIRIHLGNLSERMMAGLRLRLEPLGGAEQYDYSTGHCDWQANSCDFGDFASHEIHVVTIYPSVPLHELTGSLHFTLTSEIDGTALEAAADVVFTRDSGGHEQETPEPDMGGEVPEPEEVPPAMAPVSPPVEAELPTVTPADIRSVGVKENSGAGMIADAPTELPVSQAPTMSSDQPGGGGATEIFLVCMLLALGCCGQVSRRGRAG